MVQRLRLPRLPRPVEEFVRCVRRSPFIPVMTYCLIAVNVAVFVIGPVSGLNPLYYGHSSACVQQDYFREWGVIPSELLNNQPAALAGTAACPSSPHAEPKIPALSVLTAMFVHGGWLHLAGNMLFLFVFGAMAEERMGRAPFLLFYLAVGYLATYGYALVEMGTPNASQTLVGASGAIAGVLGAYLRLYPKARITSLIPLFFFIPLRFPAWLVLGLWFVLQWVSSGSGSGVAYPAHLIGFTVGFLWAWLRYVGLPRRLRWL
ncbi:rhomboid family intramembrane serine protease [Phaeacidiphilus oryzae]|uniref:rhomboid family intramembrane serine protease n=1 Tax=Phaeacidiphilus oryzae TaxID=348818 RepID=UPI000A00B4AF